MGDGLLSLSASLPKVKALALGTSWLRWLPIWLHNVLRLHSSRPQLQVTALRRIAKTCSQVGGFRGSVCFLDGLLVWCFRGWEGCHEVGPETSSADC